MNGKLVKQLRKKYKEWVEKTGATYDKSFFRQFKKDYERAVRTKTLDKTFN